MERDDDRESEAAASALRDLLRETVERLRADGAPQETLAVVKNPRGFGPFKTAVSMAPVGHAWRLGVLLLEADGTLHSTGKITRAVVPTRPQGLSRSVEQRRADRLAASRGRFAEGEVVDYAFGEVAQDARSLRLGSGLLSLEGETVLVRWGPAAHEVRPLAAYLADRAALLVEG